jgi:hypothetical protein
LAATTFAELAARAKIKHAPQPGKAKQHDFQARARRNKKWRCDLRVNEYMTLASSARHESLATRLP